MTRGEMLSILKSIDFRFVWPGNWDDIGFTERPIWISGKGYGYISCDEPCSNFELEGISDDKWKIIQGKLIEGTLVKQDLIGTSIEDNDWIWECIEDSDNICEMLNGLKNLPQTLSKSIYCVTTWDGFDFYSTYEEFKIAVERDECDYTWDEMTDEILNLWIERLNHGDLDGNLFG